MNDYDFRRAFGDAIKRVRGKEGLTQQQVARRANLDIRTVLNSENYRGNPKLEAVSSLIRTLYIDPWEFFFPELGVESPLTRRLRLLLSDITEEEAATLIPVVESVLDALRSKDVLPLE